MKNILIVDDRIDFSESTKIILNQGGYKADIAVNADQCVKAILKVHYDIIIMDINIYYADGRQLTSDLIKDYSDRLKNTTFIFASTRRALINADICKSMLGTKDYLSKPFTSEELFTSINNALNKQENACY